MRDELFEQSALEIVLFLVGVACLVLEVFIIPGFGIFGLGGGVMVLASLVLASQTFVLPATSGEVRELRDQPGQWQLVDHPAANYFLVLKRRAPPDR